MSKALLIPNDLSDEESLRAFLVLLADHLAVIAQELADTNEKLTNLQATL